MYDSRSSQAPFDFFASRSFPQAEETFRGVVIGVINDMLDGDLEMVRTLLCEFLASSIPASRLETDTDEGRANDSVEPDESVRADSLSFVVVKPVTRD